MCKHGDDIEMEVLGPDGCYHKRKIDRCIAPLIKELNDRGIMTLHCCCGHGDIQGSILIDPSHLNLHWLQNYDRGIPDGTHVMRVGINIPVVREQDPDYTQIKACPEHCIKKVE